VLRVFGRPLLLSRSSPFFDAHVTFVHGGSHLDMISHPCAVTNVILQVAQATA
jgi:hypothetical protein